MIKTLTKHGNSRALLIERPVLELLNIDDDTALNISTDGQKLIIEPVRGGGKKFEKGLAESKKRYHNALKRMPKR